MKRTVGILKAIMARVYRFFPPAIDNGEGGKENLQLKWLQYVWAGFFMFIFPIFCFYSICFLTNPKVLMN